MLAFIDLLLWILLLPFLIPIVTVFGVYKCVVRILILTFRPDLKLISTNDLLVARGSLDKKPISDIGFIHKVEGIVSVEELREKFRRCFLSSHAPHEENPFQNLYCTIHSYYGYICKKKVSVDLTRQIKKDRYTVFETEDDAKEYFGKWFASVHPDDGPQWEMVVVSTVAQQCYVAFRVHHGLMDGFGTTLVGDMLCDQWSPYLAPEDPRLSIWEELTLLKELPREVLSFAWRAQFQASRPFSGITSKKTEPLLLTWVTLSMSKLKTVRKALNVSFSTILYSVQSGALRRSLEEAGRGDELTKDMPALYSIPKITKHPRNTFTNHWTFAKIFIPLEERDPLARIEQIDKEFTAFTGKKLHYSVHKYFIGLLNLLPTNYCLLNLHSNFSVYRATLSPMVQAPQQYILFGHKLSNMYNVFYTKDLCPETVIYTTSLTHNGQIDLCLAAPIAMMKDQMAMNRLAQKHCVEELEALVMSCEELENSRK